MELEISGVRRRSTRRREVFIVVLLVVLFSVAAFLIGYFAMKAEENTVICRPGDGRDGNSKKPKEKYHDMFQEEVKAKNIEENLRFITSEPHMAGSQRQRDLAEHIADKWRIYEFDEVEMPEYEVPLSLPQEDNPNKVEVVVNGTKKLTILGKLKAKPEPKAKKAFDYFPYFAYSPNGTVEGELVFIKEGSEDDINLLFNRTNVSLTNKIVIVRGIYARTDLAVSLGAIGALVFPDVHSSRPNDTYPYTSKISGDAVFEKPEAANFGDPLTPGIPSIEGMYRGPKNLTAFAAIPTQPISYNDALKLLSHLQSNVVPEEWRKELNVPFRNATGLNSSDTIVRLSVNNVVKIKSIYNVIGTVYGREEPDRYVLIGSHRDAWFLGAADPSSGTAALLEISRAVSKMLREGWRPRRTLKFCSWGAEEFGLIGSIEWVEQNQKILSDRAVVYLNTDVAVGGNYVLATQNCPLLSTAIFDWAKKVKDPNAHGNKTSLYDIMVERMPSPNNPSEPYVVPYLFLSDYFPFYMYLGIPSADFSYFYGPGMELYPVYHTQEDNFYWMKTFIDPKFEFHEAVTKFEGGLLIELSDISILPFDVKRYANALLAGYKALLTKMNNETLPTGYIKKAVDDFMKASQAFERSKSKLNSDTADPLQVRMVNDQMVQIEKAFISSSMLSDIFLSRHLFFSTNSPFPGVLKAFKEGSINEVKMQMTLVVEAISSAAKILQPLPSA